jgi:pSer/pThr/pTyr-binding forkhead associated (FHA) protein
MLELWREGDRLGEVSVKGDEFLIGRPSTNRDIHPDLDLSWIPEAKQISREHALIYQDEGNYFVKDLGSKNGTYLNDAKLDARIPYPLKEGDRITLGDGIYGIIFHWQGG